MICPITKIENPIRNILVPALVFLFSSQFFGFLIYGLFFQQVWVPFIDIYRSMDNDLYWQKLLPLTNFLYGIVITILYVKIKKCESNSKLNIITYAIIIFFISRFFGEIYDYLMFPQTFGVALIGFLHGLLTLITWALISNKIFNIKTKK